MRTFPGADQAAQGHVQKRQLRSSFSVRHLSYDKEASISCILFLGQTQHIVFQQVKAISHFADALKMRGSWQVGKTLPTRLPAWQLENPLSQAADKSYQNQAAHAKRIQKIMLDQHVAVTVGQDVCNLPAPLRGPWINICWHI